MSWPPLSEPRDGPTIRTLHLLSQIAGKVPTALLPWRNHGWHLTLHVTPRGLATEPVHAAEGSFTLAFDLVDQLFALEDGNGRRTLPLGPTTVAAFHQAAMGLLAEAGYGTRINERPNEIDPAIPFADDHAPRAWDPDSARHLHAALLAADRVFRLF
ncbi:MAG: hypothetical protein JO109_13670, partial [Alphaproteobacteria bacterium]|nr:hypothetical protein [Alphaproteobacteria bacterium]